MPAVHRENDSRSEMSKTQVVGQQTVFVNGKLWAVEQDMDNDGMGQLISKSPGTVYINGKKIIVKDMDDSSPDSLCGMMGQHPEHCHPHPVEGSPDVFCYG